MEERSAYIGSPENAKQLVVWEDRYATGVEEVDEQHQRLVVLTNELYEACLTGNEEKEAMFKTAMSRMVDYVREHFAAELVILERINYPRFQEHKQQHATLVQNILEAVKEHDEGKPFVPNNFVRTLKDWVFGHIAIYDRLYADYVVDQKKKGLLSIQQINGK